MSCEDSARKKKGFLWNYKEMWVVSEIHLMYSKRVAAGHEVQLYHML